MGQALTEVTSILDYKKAKSEAKKEKSKIKNT